jgi:hypothetical protein
MSKVTAYLQEIQRRAEEIWGDRWQAEIARRYADLAQAAGDAEATYEKRRPQIYRVFREKSCGVDTLFLLAEAVGCSFEMHCSKVEVFKV